MIEVRALGDADVEAAASLAARHQPSPWSEKTFQEELSRPNRVYLAADDGDLVGFGGLMLTGDEAHVTNLFVVPELRRQGLGRRLLENLVDEAVGRGAKHLTLEVRAGNEEARSLYAAFGLVPVGVRRGYYGSEDALIMWAHDIDQRLGGES